MRKRVPMWNVTTLTNEVVKKRKNKSPVKGENTDEESNHSSSTKSVLLS